MLDDPLHAYVRAVLLEKPDTVASWRQVASHAPETKMPIHGVAAAGHGLIAGFAVVEAWTLVAIADEILAGSRAAFVKDCECEAGAVAGAISMRIEPGPETDMANVALTLDPRPCCTSCGRPWRQLP